MTLTLDLQPELERNLLAQAQAKGISLADYAHEILARNAKPVDAPQPRTGQEFLDVCARVRGLADDVDLSRGPSASRPVDFS